MGPRNPGSIHAIAVYGLALCGLVGATGTLARPLFPHPAIAVCDAPTSLISADVDGDGLRDLVADCRFDDRVVVLRANGDGTFSRSWSHTTESTPMRPVAADFDGDGAVDLAVGTFDHGVNVFMGNGDGTFGPPVAYGDDFPRTNVVVGDFNEDEEWDLLSGGYPARMSVGNGDGTFGPDVIVPDAAITGAAVADFDADGKDDYAGRVPFDDDVVRVNSGNGDGTFETGEPIPAGERTSWFHAADLNDDQVLDIAFVEWGSQVVEPKLWVLFGIGDGTFLPAQPHVIYSGPHFPLRFFVTVTDLDSDGLQDVLVPNGALEPIPSISLFFGTGGGGLTESITATTLAAAVFLVVDDFDGDGIKDMAVSQQLNDSVGWIFGRGDRTFVNPELLPVGPASRDVLVEDLNGDDRADLILANRDSSDLSVLLAEAAGTFGPAQRFCVKTDAPPPCPTGSDPAALALGELTADAFLDAAVANSEGSVSVLAGDGYGHFSFATSLTLPGQPQSLAIGDLNGDDVDDIVAVSDGWGWLIVFLGNGDGTFATPPGVPATVGSAPRAVVLSTLDGDEYLDAAVADADGNVVKVLLGSGDGRFTAAATLAAGTGPTDVAAADVNGDDVPDLAVVSQGSSDLRVYAGNGDGTFGTPVVLDLEQTPAPPLAVLIEDLDGDGHADVIALDSDRYDVFLGEGDGTFGQAQSFTAIGWDSEGGAIAAGDFNLDSRLDLVMTHPAAGYEGDHSFALIALNQSGPSSLSFLSDRSSLVWPAVRGALSYDVYRGNTSALEDVDDDGLPDSDYGSCMTALDDDARDTTFLDPEIPQPSGNGFFYLVSAIAAQGETGLGSTSAGLARVPQVPCP